MNIDQSGANKAGLKQWNRDHDKCSKIRPCKYLNNIIEQDHRRIKRLTRPMLGSKNFSAAQQTLAGIEVMAMINKGQMKTSERNKQSPAEMFSFLAASRRSSIKFFSSRSSICDRNQKIWSRSAHPKRSKIDLKPQPQTPTGFPDFTSQVRRVSFQGLSGCKAFICCDSLFWLRF